MNINTATIQRLRDALLEGGRLEPQSLDSIPGEEARNARQATLERFVPFAETMFLMMMVDDHADAKEQDAIRGAMRILTNNLLPDEVLTDIFQRCEHSVSEYGVDSCLMNIGARLSGDRLDRETAFTLAAAVALADNQLHNTESDLMGSIAEWYGISGRSAQALLQQF